MKSLMTPHHIRILKCLVQEYLDSHDEVNFDKLNKFVDDNGFMTVDASMFREWILENFPGIRETQL